MKRHIAFLFVFVVGVSLYAQTDVNDKAFETKSAEFAIVHLSANHSGDGFICILKYSDGKVFSLDKTLDMKVKEGHLIDYNDMDAQQFKILEYCHEMGYELLSISEEANFQDSNYRIALREQYPSIRFYFKRKGL